MKPRASTAPKSHRHRHRFGHGQENPIEDSYRWSRKPHQAVVCTQCGAVYSDGRWQWIRRPAAAEEAVCQACNRINDDFPAGIVTLTGAAVVAHKDEIVSLARNQEKAEKPEHPLNRIMSVEKSADGLVIKTTDIHLPRRIGESLRRAFRGKLKVHFDEKGYFVRVDWQAPD